MANLTFKRYDKPDFENALDEEGMLTLMEIAGWRIEKRRGGFGRFLLFRELTEYEDRRFFGVKHLTAMPEKRLVRHTFNSLEEAFQFFMHKRQEDAERIR